MLTVVVAVANPVSSSMTLTVTTRPQAVAVYVWFTVSPLWNGVTVWIGDPSPQLNSALKVSVPGWVKVVGNVVGQEALEAAGLDGRAERVLGNDTGRSAADAVGPGICTRVCEAVRVGRRRVTLVNGSRAAVDGDCRG